MSRLLAALLLSVALIFPARATTFSTDLSDLWWNESESGWGVNVIQQAEVLFLTFFVYGTANQPIWYVGPATTFTSGSSGSISFTGPLYRTQGPWFGGSFNPSSVSNQQVGTVTFTASAVNAATITYSVDGVSVIESVRRQTWRTNNVAGGYVGAFIGTYSGCPSGLNGYSEEPATVTITQLGSTATVTAAFSITGGTCVYRGTYTQAGRMGAINSGTISCNDGSSGTFSALEIQANITGITARATANVGSCRWDGRFGGLRRG